MNCQEFLNRRNTYSYPAVALEGTLGEFSIRNFPSTFEHDGYHKRLLHDVSDDNRILGYLSVLFWGHYSGQDAVIRERRALGKVRLAYEGADRVVNDAPQHMQGVTDVGSEIAAGYISNAIGAVAADTYDQAIAELNNLPGLQIAFSSKVCAFIDPEKCGVIDSVVAERHPMFGFALSRNGYVVSSVGNRQSYNRYCKWLQEKAHKLNAKGPDFQWTDRDGSQHRWRAVDVERALY